MERLRIVKRELGGQAGPEVREGLAGHCLGVGDDQDQVAGLCVEPLAKLRLGLLGEELGGRTGKSVGLDLEPDQSLGAERAGKLGQAVEVLAAVAIGSLGGTEPPDPMAELPGLLEDLELGQVGNVGDVFQLEAVTEV